MESSTAPSMRGPNQYFTLPVNSPEATINNRPAGTIDRAMKAVTSFSLEPRAEWAFLLLEIYLGQLAAEQEQEDDEQDDVYV